MRISTTAGTFETESRGRGLFAIRFSTRHPLKRAGHPGRDPGLDREGTIFQSYFQNPKVSFAGLRLDLSECSSFERRVYAALCRVLVGSTVTYGELARRAGFPNAARAVGTAMKKNRFPIVIPCHRVIRSDGSLGHYAAGIKWKRYLLKHEGVSVPGSEHDDPLG